MEERDTKIGERTGVKASNADAESRAKGQPEHGGDIPFVNDRTKWTGMNEMCSALTSWRATSWRTSASPLITR